MEILICNYNIYLMKTHRVSKQEKDALGI